MARFRRTTTGLLLTFVVFTAGYAIGKEVGVRRALDRMPAAPPLTAAGTHGSEATRHQLVVWYFHATKRCKKCNTIEAFAKEAIETRFADRLATGEISWQVANMDDIWNQDAVQRYGLLRSSLVLADMVDGIEQDFAVLDQVWDLTDDKETFLAHVESEVELVIDEWEDVQPGDAEGAEDAP